MLIKKFILVVMMFSALTIAAPAGAKQPAPLEPPAGCSCTECGMNVQGDALKFVSEIIDKNGKASFFCDIGDLMAFYDVMKKRQDAVAIYVRDYASGAWMDARTCVFLSGTNVKTPMRYGILAFKDRAAAGKFKKANGGEGVYTLDEAVRAKVFKR